VLEQCQVVEEVGGAGVEQLTAKLSLEVPVPLEQQDVDTPLREEQTEHESPRPSAHGARARAGHRYDAHALTVPAGASAAAPWRSAGESIGDDEPHWSAAIATGI